jgi:hypothetical protein
MELANRISPSPILLLHKLNQKTQRNRNMKVLTAFIAVSLFAGGFIAVTQSAAANQKLCQCSAEKNCRCGNNCLCGNH